VHAFCLLVSHEPLHYAGVPVLSFYIRATDHGPEPKSSVVGVTVYLVTDRDTVPTFERRMWTASVSEAARVGTEVSSVLTNRYFCH